MDYTDTLLRFEVQLIDEEKVRLLSKNTRGMSAIFATLYQVVQWIKRRRWYVIV